MPDWKDEIRQRLATLSLDPTREAEIVEELAQHLDDRYAELLAGGASHEEATRVVCVELNESETLQRELRSAEPALTREPVVEGYDVASNMLAGLWQDLRYGARMLMKKPAFTVIAIVTIALGISANTTIFSTADAMMLRPFSFPNQQRLVVLFERKPSIGVTRASISPGNVIEWRAQSQTLQEVVVMRNRDYTLTGEGSPERVSSYGVSAEFFEALGVKPLLGRTFQRGEDEAGREQVAVLSHAFWQARFGGDPQIVDQQILLDDKPFIVLGVMPKGFDFPYDGGQMWTPFVFEPKMKEDHSNHYLRALGLLRPGVSIAQANADLDQISKRVEQRYPDGEAGHSAYAEDLNGYYTRGIRVAIPGMIGSAIFVLLIACANVANLFVARTSARRKEMAVRLALGATRFRVIRQTLTESVMLALAGGAFGCLLTSWSLEAFPRVIPIGMAKYIPGSSSLALNLRVLVFTALISVLTGVLFGLVPALQGARTSLSETLKEGGRKGAVGGGGQSLLRKGLVITELALSLVLLIGAALFVRSVIQIVNADLGVKPDNVVTMTLDLPRDKYYQAHQRRAFFEQLLERVAALPGVTNVGSVHSLPMSGSNDGNRFQIVGQPPFEQGREPHTDFRIATPGYFAAIGTELRRGRLFSAQDDSQAPRVVLVNEAFAARFLKTDDPIGRRMILGDDKSKPLEIIGVVANVMNGDLNDMTESCVYLPFAQVPVAHMSLILRASSTPEDIVPAVREELVALDDHLPLGDIKTMAEVIHERRSPKELMMWMLVIFGLIALAMATVGTYAVIAYSVAERTHELGVRIALGAQTAHILGLVMRGGLTLVLIGIGLGLAGAFALTRVLSHLLYGVTSTDELTFVGVSLALLATALLACYVPARRATKVDPMVALRYE